MLDTYFRQKVDLVNFDPLEIKLFLEELDRMDGTGWNLTGRDGGWGAFWSVIQRVVVVSCQKGFRCESLTSIIFSSIVIKILMMEIVMEIHRKVKLSTSRSFISLYDHDNLNIGLNDIERNGQS